MPSLPSTLRERVQRHLDGFERRPLELEGRRHAAVVLALVPDEAGEPAFLLTRRASRLRRHAGQWALPGGRLDDGETVQVAALRELDEEVGLRLPASSVLGCLDDYPTRSGFVITPVVAWAGQRRELQPDPTEVAELHHVPLAELEAPGVPDLRRIDESPRPVISIALCGTHIHAPTAALIFQFREVALWGRATRVDHFEQPRFAWR